MSQQLQSIKLRFGIIGNSPLLDAALNTAIRVSPTDLTVLIYGESGVGKEVFSKIIHNLSSRKHNPFIAINCGAIPAGTINSELFGHEKGSFTSASGERQGYFETVNGGTIFLDEIGDMPLDTQAYLLRILESGEFIRVGSSKVQKTDVRVIAATNVALEDKIRQKTFREDLFYRLNTIPIRIPPLRERQEDIYLLFRKFSSDLAENLRKPPIQLDEKAQMVLSMYPWPGNIRELRNVAERLALQTTKPIISAEELVDLIPELLKRNLPSLTPNVPNGDFSERDLLYKWLYDMKKDLNDLKSLIFNLIHSNDLRVPDVSQLKQLQAPVMEHSESLSEQVAIHYPEINQSAQNASYIIDKPKSTIYHNTEVVEENLSLEEMEKEMIRKAIKKHGGRRKEAADDLGISERTLYRKIKQYDLE